MKFMKKEIFLPKNLLLSKFNDNEIKKNEIFKKKIMDNFEYIIKKDFLFLRSNI